MSDTAVRAARTGILKTGAILDCKVENPQGEHLGRVEDLVVDLRRGAIAYVILSFGGFFGVGNKLFAVPLTALHFKPEEQKFILSVERDVLKRAPGFDKDHWPDLSDRQWAAGIYSYYGYPPYGE